MHTPIDIIKSVQKRIVYIRPVDISELPEDMRQEALGQDSIYAVHAENGERLALVKDRSTAFALAWQNDLAPVTVH